MAGNRFHAKDAVHFITNRCEQELFLMLPKENVNRLIQEWLARALTHVDGGLEIYAFIFLSNHFHFLVKDTGGKLARFMGYFQGNLAKAVNKELCRHGSFWAREYDDVIVDDTEAAFFNRYSYIICNAVKAGLVDRADEWTGISSLDLALSERPLVVDVLNKTRLHNATRRTKNVDTSKFIERHTIALTVPPPWSALPPDVRTRHLRDLVHAGEQRFQRARDNKPPLGMKQVLKQSPLDAPLFPSFRPRIKVFAMTKPRRELLLDAYKCHVGGYKQTYDEFIQAALQGRRPAVEWPHWSYPPSSAVPIGFADSR